MAYLEGMSLRSSETLRQWFKKLQCFLPGNFSKSNLKPTTMTNILQLNGKVIGEDIFPSQKNLDMIMNTLRRDLVYMLRKSDKSHLITILIYKLNILDNNIREICRFQHTWKTYPLSTIDSLKIQEKYIIRLIEEIMDDIFDAYSSMKRKVHHLSNNERNINGVISVLGILKREVCNMIHFISRSIEELHNTFYKKICAPPSGIERKYLEPIENKKIESPLAIQNSSDSEKIEKKSINKSAQTSLPNNRSYPFIERSNGRLFSSLQNICCGLNRSNLKEDSDYFNEVIRKDVPDICSLHEIYKKNIPNQTNGRGDADKNFSEQNQILRNSIQLNYEHEDGPGISKTVKTFFAYADKNKSSLLSYDKDNSRSINIQENRETSVSKKSGIQEQTEDSHVYLYEKKSRISWPSATVIRDIKSETHLDGTALKDRLRKKENNKNYYSTDESSKDNLSDSDSDESYISCALDEFELDMTFLDHIKQKYIQEKPLKKGLKDYADRNDTKGYSCKSPKLSEIFTGPRIIRGKDDRVAEVYHSVESLPTVDTCIKEMNDSQLSRETKNIDVAICTDNEMDLKALEYKNNSWNCERFEAKEPVKVQRTLIDSFNTLALSEEFGGCDARYTESIVSFASVATETVDVKEIPSFCSNKSLQKHQALHHIVDASPNLEDSQYSAICLALPPSNIRLVNIGNEINLLAIEVEQT